MKKTKETLYAWLTHPYRLVMRDEERLADYKSYPITRAKILAITVPLIFLIFISGFWLSSYLHKHGSFGKQETQTLKRELIRLYQTVDSLEIALQHHEQYIQTLHRVIRGDVEPWKEEKKKEKASKDGKLKMPQNDSIDLNYISEAELALRSEYEQKAEQTTGSTYYQVANQAGSSSIGMLFPPLQGVISEHFNMEKKHYGIDIVSKANAPIHSVADGTVIFAGWTYETGNVIAIQHGNNLISVYKHNARLLKQVGDVVSSGEAIAIIGNTGRHSTGPHLHFELWLKGNPVNPEKLIAF
jgi:murein DD-endopeptidase MepM/ murein hydrolase activator NlpD